MQNSDTDNLVGDKRKRNEVDSAVGPSLNSILQKNATIQQRVIHALRCIGTASSAVAIIKGCAEHSEYSDAAKIRKAIKTGLSNGALCYSSGSTSKFWIGGVAEPVGPAPLSVITTEIEIGTGEAVTKGSVVRIDYELYLASPIVSPQDKAITTSGPCLERGKAFTFEQGAGDVIKGMDLGVLDMRVGGKRNVWIPSQLGYGRRGSGDIPASADLVFKIKLAGISRNT